MPPTLFISDDNSPVQYFQLMADQKTPLNTHAVCVFIVGCSAHNTLDCLLATEQLFSLIIIFVRP